MLSLCNDKSVSFHVSLRSRTLQTGNKLNFVYLLILIDLHFRVINERKQLVPNRAFKIVFSINLLLTLVKLFVNKQIKLYAPVDFIHQHKLLKTQ